VQARTLRRLHARQPQRLRVIGIRQLEGHAVTKEADKGLSPEFMARFAKHLRCDGVGDCLADGMKPLFWL